VAEYALLLFIVVVIAAGTYRFLGNRIKGSGDKTTQQFSGQSGGETAGGAGGGNEQQGANGKPTGGGAGAAASGGGGSGGGGGGNTGGVGGDNRGNGNGDQDIENVQKTPLWKIIGGVFILLFLIGGYLAFRKQKSSG
jgi:hypothetical protein